MKQLREGYTTGSCAAAASFASVLWQTSGKCPEWVELEVPAGKLLHLEIQAEEAYTCGAERRRRRSGRTNGCLVTASVEILPAAGDVQFRAGTGVGRSPERAETAGGEPAINRCRGR
ncbi:MAG: cobalt-precorrin-5B (C(1))-methyltransferase [Ruminococcus callidus]